jgi:hypothetical protein
MSAVPLTDTFERSTDASFTVKIGERTFIWGSDAVLVNLSFARPPVLHIRNYLYSSWVTLSTQVAAGTVTKLGQIAPGQCLSIQIQDIVGVLASCAAGTESYVSCVITD